VVTLRLTEDDEHRMCSADTRVPGIIDLRILKPARLQLLDPLRRFLAQIIHMAELDRLRRARLRARRRQSFFLPVVTEGALERRADRAVLVDHTERTRDHAIP